MVNEGICTTCHKPHPWPDGTMPRHPFNGGPPKKQQKQEETTRPQEVDVNASSMPFDPVLRLALIDAGVITSEDLAKAEEKLTSLTRLVTKRVEAGR